MPIIKFTADENRTENQSSHRPMLSGIQSRRIFLVHKNRSVERTLSLALPIHKVVGLGARLLGFDPDQIKGFLPIQCKILRKNDKIQALNYTGWTPVTRRN